MYQKYIVITNVQLADYTNDSKYLMWRVVGILLLNLSYLNITVIYGGLPLVHFTIRGGEQIELTVLEIFCRIFGMAGALDIY